MSKSVIKFWDKIIVVLLGFVGLSGVLNSCYYKYGMPVTEYEINGVVTDKTNAKSVQNIRVIRQKYQEYGDTIYTNQQGIYVFKLWEDFSNPVHLKFEDIDGEENGGDFETQEIDVKFTEADLAIIGKGNKAPDRYVKTQNVELEPCLSEQFQISVSNILQLSANQRIMFRK